MIIHKGFKYRLKPTDEQKRMLLQQGGNTRFVYNKLLELNEKKYKEEGKFVFGYDMKMSIPEMKKEFEFLKLSNSQSLQKVGDNFDNALQRFLKGLKTGDKVGFPSYKKKYASDSFYIPQHFGVYKNNVQIPKIGKIQWIKHKPLQGKPKSLTISQDGDQWFCSVLCEVNIKEKPFKKDNIVGIDVGLKEFATLSDETVVKRKRITKQYEEKLTKEQRKLEKKVKGSSNRSKQRSKVRKVHRKIKNVRKDFLHKTTHDMITKYDGFCLENLNVEGMVKNHKLAKSIQDVSWFEFNRQLAYKSKWNFKHYVQIDTFFPSSKTCSSCGAKRNLKLSDRTYICSKCGLEIDRDYNASINILREGLRILKNTAGTAGINACGDENVSATRKGAGTRQQSRLSSVKQENIFHIN